MARRVLFETERGNKMKATLLRKSKTKAEIQIDGDPFPVKVNVSALTPVKTRKAGREMPKTKTAKELRNEAKALGIEDYQDMTKAELQEAIQTHEDSDNGSSPKRKAKKKAPAKRAAKKTKPKGKAAKKTTKKKVSEPEGDNPFRPNTNLWHITEALMKGGKRSTLVKRLEKKLEFNPRKQDEEDLDVHEEIDRRLKVVGYILKNKHGFDMEHEGRGKDAHIKLTPPA